MADGSSKRPVLCAESVHSGDPLSDLQWKLDRYEWMAVFLEGALKEGCTDAFELLGIIERFRQQALRGRPA